MSVNSYPTIAFAATMAGTATTRERTRVQQYVDGLLAEIERQTARAEAAEAALAAVPVDALRRGLAPGGATGDDAEAIEAWILSLPEVQP